MSAYTTLGELDELIEAARKPILDARERKSQAWKRKRRRYIEKHRALGLCQKCPRPLATRMYCQRHRLWHVASVAAYRQRRGNRRQN